jgi:hypothetical protein
MKRVFMVWGCIYGVLAVTVAMDVLHTGKLLSVLLFSMAAVYNFMFLREYIGKGKE